MAERSRQIVPRTYFLNETHELTPLEGGGGGRLPKYVGISWAAKGQKISQSLKAIEAKVAGSKDPTKDRRYFVLAQPVDEVEKESKDKKKAPRGTFKEKTEFGGEHGRVFARLGLDLLQVTADGKAIVHGEKERVGTLLQRTTTLDDLGAREQARWATIDSFELVPLQLRVDDTWLRSLKLSQTSDIVIELQPVLTRVEADGVLRAITELLSQQANEKLTGMGTDFSGRHWFRGKATQKSVRAIARDFFSVQAIHSPLYSIAASKSVGRGASRASAVSPVTPDLNSLPCVAVVDLGVADDHKRLKAYRRGRFIPQDAPNPPVGDHGAFVASRVVFGDCGSDVELGASVGKCSFVDAVVADYPDGSGRNNRVNDKIVMEAIDGVRGSAPDVRVFNLSFSDSRPLWAFDEVERTEKRRLLQDLDNFVFANDAMVVVAAGNSDAGVPPDQAYPDHVDDPRWALGPWACGFNTLICGSFVSRLGTGGLVSTVGWPSPFSRIGPGICDAPIPSFSAAGGNTNGSYGFTSGLGVWGYSGQGLAEDRMGTSHAAPILARECALTIHELQQHCVAGTQPFGVTARAFLTLVARRQTFDDRIEALAKRTLGSGKATADRLATPSVGTAVMLWQGYIESTKDTVRVQLPIPMDWLAHAQRPVLRLVVCSNPPVNESAHATWACRKVSAVLHLGPEAPFVRAPSGGHGSFR